MLDDRLQKRSSEFGLSLFNRGAWFESSHHAKPPNARASHHAPIAGNLGFPGDWNCHVLGSSNLGGTFEAGWSHTYNRERNVVYVYLPANYRCVATKLSRPIFVAEHCGGG